MISGNADTMKQSDRDRIVYRCLRIVTSLLLALVLSVCLCLSLSLHRLYFPRRRRRYSGDLRMLGQGPGNAHAAKLNRYLSDCRSLFTFPASSWFGCWLAEESLERCTEFESAYYSMYSMRSMYQLTSVRVLKPSNIQHVVGHTSTMEMLLLVLQY